MCQTRRLGREREVGQRGAVVGGSEWQMDGACPVGEGGGAVGTGAGLEIGVRSPSWVSMMNDVDDVRMNAKGDEAMSRWRFLRLCCWQVS